MRGRQPRRPGPGGLARLLQGRRGSGGPYIDGHVLNLFPYLGQPEADEGDPAEALELYLREQRYTPEEIEWERARFLERLREGGGAADEGTGGLAKGGLYRNPHLGFAGSRRRGGDRGDERAWLRDGITSDQLPRHLSRVPFVWDYYATMYPMEVLAGFVGVAQDPGTLALRPEIGWAVRDGAAA